jgi:ATP-dependent Clp protease ATP-binding subunit ClpC
MSDRITDGFTQRALKILALANQAAHRSNHEYIGTEHLLIAIVQEDSGVGAYLLKVSGLTLKSVRLMVDKRVKPGPDMITMGKVPYTPRVKRVLEFAVSNAKSLNHEYVGTEHLLLALLDETDGIACELLAELGMTKAKALKYVKQLVGGFEDDDEVGCFVCKWFDMCSFAQDLNESRPSMLAALFGDAADNVILEIVKFAGSQCKIFERKSE